MADGRGADLGLSAARLEYGWIAAALLLLFLSLIPLLIPAADAVPQPVAPLETSPAARAHHRVVVMLVDGLGYRKASSPEFMPRLCVRAAVSAFGKGLASFPTITPTGLRAVFSGHRMVSEPQMPTGIKTSGEADSVMARAVAAGLKAFVVGQFTWPPLFPGGHGAELTVVPYDGISIRYDHDRKQPLVNYDQEVLDAAEPVFSGARGPWDLVVLHFFEPDSIGHALGTTDSVYADHLRWLDQRIEELSRRLQDERPTTFVLLADHGQADDGTHGGLSKTDREVPVLIWGADAKPGDLGTFPLYDAAPTLTALLGVPPPAQTEGWPLLAALRLRPRERADAERDLLQQRLRRWRTVKAVLPWLTGPSEALFPEVESLYRRKRYEEASDRAARLARALDAAVDSALPDRWLWRLIAALWLLVLGATFGLAWRRADRSSAAIAGSLGLVCLALLAFPLARPSLWSWASVAVLAGAAGIVLVTLAQGLRGRSELDAFGWAAWWTGFFGIAFQEIVDVSLWSWLVLALLFTARLSKLKRETAATTAVSAAAVVCCLLFTAGRSSEVSLARSLLPGLSSPLVARPPWAALDLLLLAALLLGCRLMFAGEDGGRRPGLAFACAAAPLASAAAFQAWLPSWAACAWGACALSAAALAWLRPSRALRGVWLAALALAYYRTVADDRQWGLVALAAGAGWALAWRTRDGHPLWEGLGLLGFGLWTFTLAGGQLSFSNITVSEGYRVLGEGWHPYALLLVLLLKPLAAVSAPILPRLAIRPLYTTLGVVPLLGALSAGNLTMLWWSRTMVGGHDKLTDDVGFARVIFVIVLAWILLALWAAARGLQLVAEPAPAPREPGAEPAVAGSLTP